MCINSSLLQNTHTQAMFWPKCFWSVTQYLQPLAEILLPTDKNTKAFLLLLFLFIFLFTWMQIKQHNIKNINCLQSGYGIKIELDVADNRVSHSLLSSLGKDCKSGS